MSTEGGERPRLEKQVTTDTEAEHSMVSERDQLTVEERERQRDAISNAKPRQRATDLSHDTGEPREVRRTRDMLGGD